MGLARFCGEMGIGDPVFPINEYTYTALADAAELSLCSP